MIVNFFFFSCLGISTISSTIFQDIKLLSLDIKGREILNLFFTILTEFDFEIKRNKIKNTPFKFKLPYLITDILTGRQKRQQRLKRNKSGFIEV